MKNVVYETEGKCEKTRATVIDAQKMCAQTKQELADLKTHLAAEKRMKSILNCEGHLIWRIDQFAAKLKDAKENGIIVRSPMFSNRPYGYNLRVCWSFYFLVIDFIQLIGLTLYLWFIWK